MYTMEDIREEDMEEKNVQAYIAVADMNDLEARFSVLGEAQGTKTPSQFFESSSKPVVLLNAGYFWDGHSLGLIVSIPLFR